MTAIKHQTVVTIANNPLYEVSKNAWNDAHLLPGATGEVFYADGASGIAALANGTGVLSNDGSGALSWTPVVSGVSSVSNVDGTLTISPTTGAVVASLNLAHANTWTGQQTFSTLAPVFSTMTAGSVFFAGASGLLSQDNTNFFWDDTNNQLLLKGSAASTASVYVQNTAHLSAITLDYQGSGTGPTDEGCEFSCKNTDGVGIQVGQVSPSYATVGFLQASNSYIKSVIGHLAIYTIAAKDLIFGTATTSSFLNERLRILGAAGSGSVAGNAGLGVVNPTAILHIKAGSTTAGTAPFKLTSGSLNTTAEAGAVEFLTDKFYATITTGTARKELTLNDAALTSGRVPYVTANGRLVDTANFQWDNSNARLGVGVTPAKMLHVQGTSTTEVAAFVRNTTSGTTAYAGMFVSNDNAALTDYIWLYKTSTAYTTSGLYTQASGGLQNTTGALVISNVAASQDIVLAVGGMVAGSEALRIDANKNVSLGNAALATTATDGFLYIPTCAGTPTGVPTAKTGRVPLIFDTTNNFLYIRTGGVWKKTTVFA